MSSDARHEHQGHARRLSVAEVDVLAAVPPLDQQIATPVWADAAARELGGAGGRFGGHLPYPWDGHRRADTEGASDRLRPRTVRSHPTHLIKQLSANLSAAAVAST